MAHEKFSYELIGRKIGWDFSKIEKRIIVKHKKWNFFDVVSKYLDTKKMLLDLGTGSGEKLFKIAAKCKWIIGVDSSKSMVNKAKKNLLLSKIKNIKFRLGNSNKLPFESESFDIVISRHAPFNIKEVARVLKMNGIFLTQQVGERDKQNIKDVFTRGQSYHQLHGNLINKYSKDSKKLKLKVLRKDHYHSTEYYGEEDLIFLLENTPVIPSFNAKKDMKVLQSLKAKYGTKLGIKTNACRYLLVLQKV